MWFTDKTTFRGTIVKSIDRGTIIAIHGGKPYFLFIPKDQIGRLEFHERDDTGLIWRTKLF